MGRRTAKRLSGMATPVSHDTIESFNGIRVQNLALTVYQARRGLTLLRLALAVPTTSGSFIYSTPRDFSSQSGATGMNGALGADGCGGCGHDKVSLGLYNFAVIANV